jgi:hypothetical protein
MSEKKFYDDGLRFECQKCSACCRHDPGYVFLTKTDLDLLVEGTGLNEADFLNKYCVTVDLGGFKRISLIEKSNYDCIFWEEGGCTVYNSRPVQCRTFPFWISSLEDKADWDALAADCPGIGKGEIIFKEEIEKKIEERQKEPMLTV